MGRTQGPGPGGSQGECHVEHAPAGESGMKGGGEEGGREGEERKGGRGKREREGGGRAWNECTEQGRNTLHMCAAEGRFVESLQQICFVVPLISCHLYRKTVALFTTHSIH